MSEVKVNKISPRTACGTTTLGDSGDTFNVPNGSKINVASGGNITIASGATITNNGTQTGFGRTGAVNWDTTVKTTGFTAVSGNGYFCNTTSGGFTLTLPSSPSAGDIIAFKDYADTFDTGNLTIGRGGSNIGGIASDSTISTEGIAATIVYIDSTKGWLVTESGLQSDVPGPQYVTATGGNSVATVCTNFKVHTFTGPGTFCVSCAGNPSGSNKISYLIVAGGGGAGGDGGGGGGGGGFRESRSPFCSYTASPTAITSCGGVSVSAQGYPIVVGAGGAGASSPPYASNKGVAGSTSSGFSIDSAGGGGGAMTLANSGGSGGGGGRDAPRLGAAGNTPPVSPVQGHAGGNGDSNGGAGGGGGASAVGAPAACTHGPGEGGGNGGAGGTTSIPGSPTAYAGGGGGGATPSPNGRGTGGAGGGGNGSGCGSPACGVAGTVNTGGGGGGSTGGPTHGNPAAHQGKAGGSGIVIIRYKFQG